MAERRMFSSKIVCSDAFTEMPFSAQALYFQLNMEADDDGFLNNARRVQRTICASEEDLNLLFAKRFILGFKNGVVVIKHWRMNNQIRKDRYTATQYQEEFNSLEIRTDGAYTEKKKEPVDTLATTWQPDGNQMATQVRLGKDSIGKGSIDILPGAETPPAPPEPPKQPKPPKPPKEEKPLSPVVITILLNDGSEYPVRQADVDGWQTLYQAVDIMQELRKMKGWADANPSKRKTKNGIKRFINSWLAKEQDKYHGPAPGDPRQGGNGQNENIFMQMREERRGRG